MNKYLSALATTLITFTICGQTNSNYVPLVREGVEWTFTVSYENSFGFNYMRNVTEHFSGDTTVNGVTYKKLYRHEPENPYSSATPVAGMREANGAVHVIYFGNVPLHNGIDATVNQDIKLYDFAHADSLLAMPQMSESTISIGGTERKAHTYEHKITSDGDSIILQLIEGVGVVSHGSMFAGELADPFRLISTGNINETATLYSVKENGQEVYRGPAYGIIDRQNWCLAGGYDNNFAFYKILDRSKQTLEVTYRQRVSDSSDPNAYNNLGTGIDSSIELPYLCYGSSLDVVYVPSRIGSHAFEYSTIAKTLTLPNVIESIGDSAFYHSSLTEITLPENVTIVEASAFDGCSNLYRATLPATLKSIGANAFKGTALKVIYNRSSVPQEVAGNAFEGVDKAACKLYVPAGSVEAYKNAPVWKEFFVTDEATGIDTTSAQAKTVAKIEYVGPTGVVSSIPVPGINIVITRYTDGSRSIGKQLH